MKGFSRALRSCLGSTAEAPLAATPVGAAREPSDALDAPDTCWICLGGALDVDGGLVSPCVCPRSAHARCLARWQLQRAGGAEETRCRFCGHNLPDWRPALTVDAAAERVPCERVCMAVTLNGNEHRIEVAPGERGRARFERDIRELFELHGEDDLEFTFDCQDPCDASAAITLEGRSAFDAAFHCAAITAARRRAK